MLHAKLVNDRFGDPALFLEMLHRREAFLFDAGDLSPLGARNLLRISHLFITHMHMDHFIGFDSLLRVHVGRSKTIRVIVPPAGSRRIGHKLQAYDWDLVDRYQDDLVFEVIEVGEEGAERACTFCFKNGFEHEQRAVPANWRQVAGLRLETALLEHHGPCLGFAVSESAHVNVWKTRIEEHGLAPGKWLQELKEAIRENLPPDTMITLSADDQRPLSELSALVTITRGQKIAYVTDVADTAFNRAAITRLAADADLFFLEARFAAEDCELANERAHLTTRASGEIARAAAVRRVEPFHFSPRYQDDEARMLEQVQQAFLGSARRQAGFSFAIGEAEPPQ